MLTHFSTARISSISSPGDLNNDDINDMLIGSIGADLTLAGAAYIIYGRGDLIFKGGFED